MFSRVARSFAIGLVFVGVLAAHPGLAQVQAANPSAPDPRTLAYLQSLFSEGRLARVRSLGAQRIVAGPGFTSEGMRDVDSSGVVTITSWDAIERIDARGGSPGRGAMIGGIVGLGAGVAIMFLTAMGDETSRSASSLVGGILVFTGTGAATGALVGALFPGWQKVYPGQVSPGSSWGLEKK
ncbi:MAG TPA: hypothetical protein VFQ05_18590 [Candidatus Eisenbacteria bacterium]|nr:hypothetical protein [Candidatus Eisenbacteria bacterium]